MAREFDSLGVEIRRPLFPASHRSGIDGQQQTVEHEIDDEPIHSPNPDGMRQQGSGLLGANRKMLEPASSIEMRRASIKKQFKMI